MSNAIWVVGNFTGPAAKSVIDHAEAGIGYLMISKSGSREGSECLAAFRMVPDKDGIPNHLNEVRDPFKIKSYEDQLHKRNNLKRTIKV